MISDVQQQQQQQEEEHNSSQESLGMQSHPSLDATSPAISAVSTNSLDWCNLFNYSPDLSPLFVKPSQVSAEPICSALIVSQH